MAIEEYHVININATSAGQDSFGFYCLFSKDQKF